MKVSFGMMCFSGTVAYFLPLVVNGTSTVTVGCLLLGLLKLQTSSFESLLLGFMITRAVIFYASWTKGLVLNENVIIILSSMNKIKGDYYLKRKKGSHNMLNFETAGFSPWAQLPSVASSLLAMVYFIGPIRWWGLWPSTKRVIFHFWTLLMLA